MMSFVEILIEASARKQKGPKFSPQAFSSLSAVGHLNRISYTHKESDYFYSLTELTCYFCLI